MTTWVIQRIWTTQMNRSIFMTDFMRLALSQAALVVDKVYPYPGVGVVIVHQGKIIAKAHNGEPGQPHAEVRAITEVEKGGWNLSECSLYTNLEPCCNIGVQPACTQLILKAGIEDVHIALIDPYHLVRGKGIEQLRAARVQVQYGEYEEEVRWMLRRYLERFCPHCGWPIVDGKVLDAEAR